MTPCEPSGVQPICAWSEGTRRFAIHLDPAVLGRLGPESWIAYKSVPRRGLEIGGILLGRKECDAESTTFWIDNYHAVESEHRTGPSYLLSDSDLAQLQSVQSKNAEESIGLYRSHTRSPQAETQDSDNQLFEKCFADADGLFLVLGAVPRVAVLFHRTDGNLKRVHEFALASTLESILSLRQTDRPLGEVSVHPPSSPEVETRLPRLRHLEGIREQISGSHPHTKRAPLRIHSSVRPSPLSAIRPGIWSLVLATLALSIAVTVSALSYSRRPAAAATLPPGEFIHLTVERTGSSLRLVWDRNSPSIRGASRAVLLINDGNYQSYKELSPAQLREGGITYEPKSREETFRLDTYAAEPRGTGFIQVTNLSLPVAATPVVSTAPSVNVEPVSPPTPAPSPREAAAMNTAKKPEAAPPTALKSERLAPTPSSPEIIPPPAVLERQKPSLPPERLIVSTPDPPPSVHVSAEPVSSRFGHLIGKVPLLRRLGKPARKTAPVPVYQAQPNIVRIPERQRPTRPVAVEVKVDVAESGAVRHAEVTEYGDPPNWTLADAALAAARRWTFQPARVDDSAVPSEVILRFRFTP